VPASAVVANSQLAQRGLIQQHLRENPPT
jgi:hypothetical protein